MLQYAMQARRGDVPDGLLSFEGDIGIRPDGMWWGDVCW